MRMLYYSYVLEILKAVKNNAPIKSTKIRENVDIPQATIYRYTNKLVERGILEKEEKEFVNPDKLRPKKAQTFSLTDKGAELISPLERVVKILEEEKDW